MSTAVGEAFYAEYKAKKAQKIADREAAVQAYLDAGNTITKCPDGMAHGYHWWSMDVKKEHIPLESDGNQDFDDKEDEWTDPD